MTQDVKSKLGNTWWIVSNKMLSKVECVHSYKWVTIRLPSTMFSLKNELAYIKSMIIHFINLKGI
jgi:hypothetical protein